MSIQVKNSAGKKAVARGVLDLPKSKSKKGFPAHKHCGVLKHLGDPVKLQKSLRDEWERDLG
jgi:hypothetical protein